MDLPPLQRRRRASRSAIADALGSTAGELRDLRRAALLHDIGKLGVSNLILDKPGKLDDDEWARDAPPPGADRAILERVSAFRDLADVAGAHHERLDGSGYHRGLRREQLDRDARILAVADVCEALSAERPYRAALDPDEVLEIMRARRRRRVLPRGAESRSRRTRGARARAA